MSEETSPRSQRLLSIIGTLPSSELRKASETLLNKMSITLKSANFRGPYLDIQGEQKKGDEVEQYFIRIRRDGAIASPYDLQDIAGMASGGAPVKGILFSTGEVSSESKSYAETMDISIVGPSRFVSLLEQYGIADDLEVRSSEEFVKTEQGRTLPSMNALDSLMEMGQDAYLSKKYEEAIEHFNHALGIKPNFDKAWYMLGLSLKSVGRPEKALDALKQALSHNGENNDAWLLLAAVLHEQHRYEEELECYDVVLGENAGDHEVWKRVGEALYQMGRHEDAVKAFEQAIKLDEYDVETLTGKARSLSAIDQNRDALKAVNEALDLDDVYQEAQMLKADILHALGEEEDAVLMYDKILSKMRTPRLYYHKGLALMKIGMTEDALEAFDSALKMDPAWEEVIIAKKVALGEAEPDALTDLEVTEEMKYLCENCGGGLKEGDSKCPTCGAIVPDMSKEDVILHFCGKCGEPVDPNEDVCPHCGEDMTGEGGMLEEVYEEDAPKEGVAEGLPEEHDSQLEEIIIDEAFGNLNEALDLVTLSIEEDPNDPELRRLKGDVLFRLRKFDDAIESYDEALERHRTDAASLLGKENAYISKEDLKEALKCNDKLLKLSPGDPFVLCRRGAILSMDGKKSKAITAYKRALEAMPDLAEAWNAQGMLHLDMEHYDSAMNCFDRAIQSDTENPLFWANRGFVHMLKDEWEKAISSFNRAVDIDPDFYEAKYNLAWAVRQTGELNRAIEILRRAMKLKDLAEGHLSLAMFHYDNESYDAAEKEAKRAVMLDKECGEAYNLLGLMLKEEDKYVVALDMFESAKEYAPNLEDLDKNIDELKERIEAIAADEAVAGTEGEELVEEDKAVTACPSCGAKDSVVDGVCRECGKKVKGKGKPKPVPKPKSKKSGKATPSPSKPKKAKAPSKKEESKKPSKKKPADRKKKTVGVKPKEEKAPETAKNPASKSEKSFKKEDAKNKPAKKASKKTKPKPEPKPKKEDPKAFRKELVKVSGVGGAMADRIIEAGYVSREKVRGVSVDTLAKDVQGVSKKLAKKIKSQI